MAPLPDLSNEQKLTYIYHTLKNQEARQKRQMWYSIVKKLIFIGIIAVIFLYPKEILGNITAYLKPLIVEQSQGIIEENKANLIKSIKDVLPENIQIETTTPQTTSPVKSKTGNTIPIRKTTKPI